jgi:predicted CXXCH cytochrome family protein
MKTKALLVVTLLVGMAASAQAGIVGSKHDLSNDTTRTTSFKSLNQNQTCVFCHTPHSAVTNKLLWNRTNPNTGASFKIYTSYNNPAFRAAGKLTQNALDDNSSSLLCLSCHALGSLAAIMTNTANNGALGDTTGQGAGRASNGKTWTQSGGAGLSTTLTNTHPIGIDYAKAVSVDATGLKAMSGTGTSDPTNGTKVRFFSSQNVANSLECASCHTVHEPANGYFLAASNTGSALCVACHTK